MASTSQRNRDVIAGAQYYYDSKTLAENKREMELGMIEVTDDDSEEVEEDIGRGAVENINEQEVGAIL